MAERPAQGGRARLGASAAALAALWLAAAPAAALVLGDAAEERGAAAQDGAGQEDAPVLLLRRGSQTRDLSLRDLAALPQHTIVTENDFTDGAVAYTGPLARDVIALLDLDDYEMLRFAAANDYSIDIPTSDFADYDAVLATKANGEALSLRTKGPIWLMYPLTDHPELVENVYIHRLVWQLVRIEAP